MTIVETSIAVLYYNAKSLIPKPDDLHAITEVHNPDVICVVQTWLGEKISSAEVSIPDYQLLRLDRNCHGGGVLMYVRNNLVTNVLLCGPHNLELLIISVSKSVSTFCIGTFYRPPSSPYINMDYFYTSLASIDSSRFSNFVLLGDFNIHYEDSHHPLYHKLQDFVQSFSLIQVVPEPTQTTISGAATLIDLAFLSNPELLLKCDVIPPSTIQVIGVLTQTTVVCSYN